MLDKKYWSIGWLIKLILEYECDYANVAFLGISAKPAGQKMDYNAPFHLRWYFRSVWIDEIYNGGYTGDVYGGVMYLRLLPCMYLTFSYDM